MDHYYHRMKNFTENRKKKKIILPLIFQTFFLLIRFKEKLLIWISKKNYFSFFCLNVIAFTFYLINYSFVSPLLASWRFKWVHANSTVEFLKPEVDERKGRKKSHLVYTFFGFCENENEKKKKKNVLSLFKFSEVFLSLTFGKSAVKKEKSRNWNL